MPLPIGGCTAQHHSCSWKGLGEQAGLGAMGQGLYCAGEGAHTKKEIPSQAGQLLAVGFYVCPSRTMLEDGRGAR